MTIDLSTCPPGTVGKTRDGRTWTLVAVNHRMLDAYNSCSWISERGAAETTAINGKYHGKYCKESYLDIVSVTVPASAPKQPDAVAAAILVANGDYDSEGLLHDVDWLEDVVRMGE